MADNFVPFKVRDLRAYLWGRYALSVERDRSGLKKWVVVDTLCNAPITEPMSIIEASNTCDRIARDMHRDEKQEAVARAKLQSGGGGVGGGP